MEPMKIAALAGGGLLVAGGVWWFGFRKKPIVASASASPVSYPKVSTSPKPASSVSKPSSVSTPVVSAPTSEPMVSSQSVRDYKGATMPYKDSLGGEWLVHFEDRTWGEPKSRVSIYQKAPFVVGTTFSDVGNKIEAWIRQATLELNTF